MILYTGLQITNTSVCLMAYEKTQTTQSVRNYAVVSSAAFNLRGCVSFLKFMSKAPELVWSNHFMGGGLITAKYSSSTGCLYLDGEWI